MALPGVTDTKKPKDVLGTIKAWMADPYEELTPAQMKYETTLIGLESRAAEIRSHMNHGAMEPARALERERRERTLELGALGLKLPYKTRVQDEVFTLSEVEEERRFEESMIQKMDSDFIRLQQMNKILKNTSGAAVVAKVSQARKEAKARVAPPAQLPCDRVTRGSGIEPTVGLDKKTPAVENLGKRGRDEGEACGGAAAVADQRPGKVARVDTKPAFKYRNLYEVPTYGKGSLLNGIVFRLSRSDAEFDLSMIPREEEPKEELVALGVPCQLAKSAKESTAPT